MLPLHFRIWKVSWKKRKMIWCKAFCWPWLSWLRFIPLCWEMSPSLLFSHISFWEAKLLVTVKQLLSTLVTELFPDSATLHRDSLLSGVLKLTRVTLKNRYLHVPFPRYAGKSSFLDAGSRPLGLGVANKMDISFCHWNPCPCPMSVYVYSQVKPHPL